MISLTNEERKLRRKQKVCYICKKRFTTVDKKYNKNRDERSLSLHRKI